jgi:hypothetical protein
MIDRKLDENSLYDAQTLKMMVSFPELDLQVGRGLVSYRSEGEQNIVGLDELHDIPSGEDSSCHENNHQNEEGVCGDSDISAMVVVSDCEERRKSTGHG